MNDLPKFDSLEEEVRWLRGLISVQRMADEILEDCLERQLGLAAAIDVFLAQTARMIHARGAYAQIVGTHEPVLTRVWGNELIDISQLAHWQGPMPFGDKRTLFVKQLNLGSTVLGSLGYVLPGTFEEGGKRVMPLVDAIGEMLDSAVLSFIAIAEGQTPLQRLDELSEANAFRPRSRIGRYELVTPLGTGGMAQVMVARTVSTTGISRLVALKRILPHLSGDKTIVEQFLDEARIGMRLSHPNLITFHDFGQAAGGGYFISMELVRGVDFDHVIYDQPGQLDPALVSGVLAQALRGLHAAHELKGEDGTPMGLVHRDLSPHNLMCAFDGRVKVLDFGVAKIRNQRTITLPGIVKGKPLYMSPEQAVAERVDRRSDLFSMGLILYEALTGARAFQRATDTITMEAIVHDPLPRNERIGDRLWAVIDRALQKEPEKRFRHAAEMAEALEMAQAPASEHALARHLMHRFPAELHASSKWEQVPSLATPGAGTGA